MPFTLQHLTHPSPIELQQIRAIYEASFPPAERKDFNSIQQRLQAGDYLCFVAQSFDAVAAFALLLPLPKVKATFLEYIAVHASHQSQGLGGELLRFIIAELETSLIWEVEPPVDGEPDDIRNRRLRFYEQLGGQHTELSTFYAMPDFENGGRGVPLRLMQFPAGKQPDESVLASIVCNIYAVAYSDWDELRDEVLRSFKGLSRDKQASESKIYDLP